MPPEGSYECPKLGAFGLNAVKVISWFKITEKQIAPTGDKFVIKHH